ncbi:hypothetical protein Hamer_G026642 [Homarus americanus]|uniref:Uncharacterized protein n=1 Tax=Homarus americanus TaxID=6706 RepID=A0A8J5JE54_HOMAM|nr:hypothetical protein Hamer_G026642 [Homarus americanus]
MIVTASSSTRSLREYIYVADTTSCSSRHHHPHTLNRFAVPRQDVDGAITGENVGFRRSCTTSLLFCLTTESACVTSLRKEERLFIRDVIRVFS